MVYKMMNNLVGIRLENFYEMYVSTYNTRSHELRITNSTPKSEMEKLSFSKRTVPMWNNLPAEVVTAKSITAFKSKIRNVNLDGLTATK